MAGEKCIMLDADYVDACNAVREKGGSTSPAIKSSELGPAIRAIPAGGPAPVIQPLEITENGEYTAPPGVDGYSPVSVNVPSGGGGDHTLEDALVSRSITEYRNDRVTEVGDSVFVNWTTLTKLELPNLVTAHANWASGTSLVHINFPNWENVGGNDFRFCKTLVSAILPKVASVPNLGTGESFETADLMAERTNRYASIPNRSFLNFKKLKSVILRKTDSKVELINVGAFTGSGVELGTGYIYVPKALVEQYKAATNWVTYAAQIRAIEDYPDITGG